MVSTRIKRTKYQQQQQQTPLSPIRKKPTAKDAQKWEIVYNNLKQLLLATHSQVEPLLQERNLLKQRLLNHHFAWQSDLTLLNNLISQLRRQLELSKLANLVDISKAHLLLGSNQRDAFLANLKLEDARSELDKFRAWFDILSRRCPPDQEDIAPDWLYEILRAKGDKNSSPEAASDEHCKRLEMDIAALKREYDKLSLKSSSDVSSLRTELKFAWNQFNEKESNFTNQLQAKNEEIKKANDKIATLLARFERLQSSNVKKDERVSTLRANITRLEDEARQKDKMIASCFKELELLKSKRPLGIPPLKRCLAEPSPCSSKRTNSSMDKERPDHANEGSSFALLEAANATLRAELNKLEIEANHKNGEIGSLSKELNLLRSKGVGNTPVLSRCTSTLPSSKLRSQGNCSNRGCAAPNEEASSRHLVSGKVSSYIIVTHPLLPSSPSPSKQLLLRRCTFLSLTNTALGYLNQWRLCISMIQKRRDIMSLFVSDVLQT